MVDLTISIISNNNRALIKRCLETIYENTKLVSFEIIVVDNCSRDGSAEMIRNNFPGVRLIENSEPDGFSANHNRALRVMSGRYVVILNDDTEVLPGCFDKMYDFMKSNPDVGCLGCRILCPDGSLQQSVYRMPTLSVLFYHAFFLNSIFPNSIRIASYRNWPHNTETDVSFVIGACMMFPSELIRNIGLLDDTYYIYFEDADICKKVLDAGRRVVFFPGAEIIHHGGASMKQVGEIALHNAYRSKLIFYRKHYGAHTLPLVAALDVIGAANRIAAWSLLKIIQPGQRKHYDERIGYFKRVVKWYFMRKNRLPPRLDS